MRIELTTSSLPRKCSTPELQRLTNAFFTSLISFILLPAGTPIHLSLPQSFPTPGQQPFSIFSLLRAICPVSTGAEDEVRTRDLQLGRLSLYQLSYFRIHIYASCGQIKPIN